MDDRELAELENEDNWDFEAAFVHPPAKSGRAVVPVAFERDEFAQLAAYARSRGLSVSECIQDLVRSGLDHVQSEVNTDTSDVVHDPLD